jgi:arylsulfatase A-like enzyme
MRPRSQLVRDLLVGVAALAIHFAIDAAETWENVTAAMKRVKSDPAATEAAKPAIYHYVAGVAACYLLLGLFAGLCLYFWGRLVRPRRPLLFSAVSIVIAAVLGDARQMIVQPGMHDWFLYRWWYASYVPPEVPTGLFSAFVLVGLVIGARRSPSAADFARAVLPLAALGLALGALWRVPTPDAPAKNTGPNIIVIGFDALRPDHLGYYGYERKITPNIDAFLAESAVWDDAFTPLARTAPSWATILTGDYPTTHEIRDPLPDPGRLVPKVPNLARTLHDRGWFTSFATDDSRFSYMVPEHGFDAILEPPVNIANFALSGSEPRFRAFYGMLDNPLGWAFVPIVRMNEAFGRSYRPYRYYAAVDEAIAEASKHEHFFFATHDCTLHAPADRFYPYDLLFDQIGYSGHNRFRYASLGTTSISDKEGDAAESRYAHQNLNLYDAGVSMIDTAFGRMRGELEASGLWENSIVVLLSDHGEDFWEQGQRYEFHGPNHGFHPWGIGQQHVVLAIHWPKGLPGVHPAGRQTNFVNLADLAPTLMDAIGVPWKSDGRLLTDATPRILLGETALTEDDYWKRDVPDHRPYPFSSASASYTLDPATGRLYGRLDYRDAVIRAKDRFAMDDRWKLVWYPLKDDGQRLDLFEWRADPRNDHDVDGEHPEVVERLWGALRPALVADGISVPEAPLLQTPAAEPAVAASPTPSPSPAPHAP